MRLHARTLASVFCLLFSYAQLCPADTYNVVTLVSDNGYNFAGMDDEGHVSFFKSGLYFNYLNGVSTGITSTAPTFIQDNGTPCTPPVPSGVVLLKGVCNGDRYAFTGWLSADLETSGFKPQLYDDSIPPVSLGRGTGILLYMNSLGDIVFNDPTDEWWVEAIDLDARPAPEPSSLALLTTGLSAGVFWARRRRTVA